jgi:hypothetical protein
MFAELDPILRARAGNLATLVVDSFCGVESQPVATEGLDAIARAINGEDATALYRLTYSYAPFHCPECALCYCGEHWQWHSFVDDQHDIDGIERSCPQGHFHVLVMGL